MNPPRAIAILGAGLAGLSVARGLRRAGHVGPVTIVSDERHAPYDRPPMSKGFLAQADAAPAPLPLDDLGDTELLVNRPAVSIDIGGKRLALADGTSVPWDALIIATGARARTFALLDHGSVPHAALRTLDDALLIRQRLLAGARLAVIGAGPIGLELAATANRLGVQVTVIEAAGRVMGRCTPQVVSDALVRHHARNGIDFRLGRCVVRAGTSLELDDGTTVQCDFAVVGIGVHANDALAADAGVACDDGIFVDGWGRTTAPGVYATGDVTRQRHPVSGRFERIETWANAQDQSFALGTSLVDPTQARPYDAVPWFWSDQADLHLQAAGLPAGDEQVIRGDPEGPSWLALQLRGQRVVGVTAMEAPREFALVRRLIASRTAVDPALLADPHVDLRALLSPAQRGRAMPAPTASGHVIRSPG